IPEGQCAGLEKVGYQQTGRSAKQIQQIVDQSASELALVDHRLKQLRVANLLHLTQRALLLQPAHKRLNGRISDPLFLRQTVANLADGTGAKLPILLEDACLGLAKPRFAHAPTISGNTTTRSVGRSSSCSDWRR